MRLAVYQDLESWNSNFYGIAQITLSYVYLIPNMSFNLLKTGAMKKDDFILNLNYPAKRILNSGECLHFKIDGKVHSLKPVSSDVDIRVYKSVDFRIDKGHFVIKRDLLNEIAKSDTVLIKVDFFNISDQTCIWYDADTYKIKKFLEKAEQLKL